jgi:hypothetical protein
MHSSVDKRCNHWTTCYVTRVSPPQPHTWIKQRLRRKTLLAVQARVNPHVPPAPHLNLGGHSLLMLHTPLPRLRLTKLIQAHTLLQLVIYISVRNLRNEALGLPCLVDNAVKLINLFERKTLSLVNHEPDESNADEAESSPDEENLGLEIGALFVDHVGSGVSDGPVEEPVARKKLV